jgi:hypothetical protein
MKEDLNLRTDLSLLLDRKGLCTAVERDGAICFSKTRAKKLCLKHYMRWKRYGDYNIASKKEFLERSKNAT